MKRSDEAGTTRVGTAERSWIQRAHADGAARRHSTDGLGDLANVRQQSPGQGWDPYDVWLSRIERPRRKRQDMAGR